MLSIEGRGHRHTGGGGRREPLGRHAGTQPFSDFNNTENTTKRKEPHMENNPNTENNPNPQIQTPPAQPEAETQSFMKKWADKLPGWMFPKLNPKSAHTCAIVGLVLGAFSLLLAIVPCVGGNAWFFGIPALYVCLMALRSSSPSEQKNGTMTTVGAVLAVLATLIAFLQIAMANEAAKSLEDTSRDFERAADDFERSMNNIRFDF